MPSIQSRHHNQYSHSVNGVLLVDKKKGCTSHDLVSQLRKIIGQKQVGHGGTLDPIAEGLILILLGQGTKLSDYLLNGDKSYRFIFRLGVSTDTLDYTGKVLNQKSVQISSSEVKKVLERNQGDLVLSVPLFSAVKIQGRKLYDYTRSQQSIVAPKRKMRFTNLVVKKILKNLVEVELSCTKGSYIRSWVASVGEQLKTGACLEALIRLKSHPFELKSALTIEQIKKQFSNKKVNNKDCIVKNLDPAFIPFFKALPHIESVIVTKREKQDIQHGRISSELILRLKKIQKEVNQSENKQIIKVMNHSENQILALLELNTFKPPKILRVFNLYMS